MDRTPMTTKPLPRFWKALDELPGTEADHREWSERLGPEFAVARRYLRKTGKHATAMDCPSPGGDGCPRAVIKLRTGRFRAVCRSVAGQCDALDLTVMDVSIFGLDRRHLYDDLGSIFCTSPSGSPVGPGRVVLLGEHAVAAGMAAPVFLVMPGFDLPITTEDMQDAGLGPEQAVVLVPTADSLPSSMRSWLSRQGHQVVALAAATAVNAEGGLILVQPVEVLLHAVRSALQARLDSAGFGTRIALPPGTTWGQISFRLTSTATVICSGPGVVGRQLDPSDLGMRSGKNAKPTSAWTLFVELAAAAGALKIATPSLADRVKKQKQVLAGHLRETFGIADDPIPWDKSQGAYVARFIVGDERPKEEREPQRRR
jgi:hypothetical protein